MYRTSERQFKIEEGKTAEEAQQKGRMKKKERCKKRGPTRPSKSTFRRNEMKGRETKRPSNFPGEGPGEKSQQGSISRSR